MNDQPNHPPNSNQPPVPEDSTTAWESAMSRDFEDRVRDLHETPLTFDAVKGKAMSIRRNRRIAVAGGVLAAAAVIVPVAVIASDVGNTDTQPDFAPAPDDSVSPDDGESTDVPIDEGIDTAGIDYIYDGTWYRADGTEVELPGESYFEAVVWNDQLVASRIVGEGAYAATEVIDADGDVVDELMTTGGLAVSNDHSILAYVTDAGDLVTRWDGGQSVLATDVTDSGGGESPGAAPVSVIGTAPCEPESGACLVRVNTDFECRGYGSSDVPLPSDALRCADEQDGALTYTNRRNEDLTQCGGLSAGGEELLWETCDYEVGAISPDGAHVLAPPSVYDGLGYKTLAILDATTGEVTGQYGAEGDAAFIWSDAGWSDDGNAVFTVYDGANWHLMAMAPDGEIAEITDPVAGEDVDNPFVVIQD